MEGSEGRSREASKWAAPGFKVRIIMALGRNQRSGLSGIKDVEVEGYDGLLNGQIRHREMSEKVPRPLIWATGATHPHVYLESIPEIEYVCGVCFCFQFQT